MCVFEPAYSIDAKDTRWFIIVPKMFPYESYPPSYTCPTPLFRASRTYSLVSDCDAMNILCPTSCNSARCTHKLTAIIISSSRRFPTSVCALHAQKFLSSRVRNALPEFPSFETHLFNSLFSKQSQPCLKRLAPRSSQILCQLQAHFVSVFLVRRSPSHVHSCCNTVPK